MTEEEKRAFEVICKLPDGRVMINYYVKSLNSFADVRNCKVEDVEYKKLAVDFIEKEFVNKMKAYAGLTEIGNIGNDDMM